MENINRLGQRIEPNDSILHFKRLELLEESVAFKRKLKGDEDFKKVTVSRMMKMVSRRTSESRSDKY